MMAATSREFLRLGVATGLATAAASLAGGRLLAAEIVTGGYQRPQDPANLSALEMAHWPKLAVEGRAVAGQTVSLSIQIGHKLHPMLAEHHIEWVEVWASGKRLERIEFDEATAVEPALTVRLTLSEPT